VEHGRLVERYLRAVLEPAGDGAALDSLVDPEFIDYGYNAAANRPRAPLRGVAAVRARHRLDEPPACPDQRIALTAIVAERDVVAAHLSCEGTHRGQELMGAAPSGRAVRYAGLLICRVKDGRIFEQWGGFDSLGLAQQLGVAPSGTWPAVAELPPRPADDAPASAPVTPRELVRHYSEVTFNERAFGALETVVDPRYADHSFGATDPSRGPDALRGAAEAFIAVFPDCRVRVDDLFAAGDLVCVRLSSRGTHRGAWLEIAPTGKGFSYEGTFIWRVRDGKLRERWGGFDRLWMAQQIGAVDQALTAL
jgi:predicted ester cyclase